MNREIKFRGKIIGVYIGNDPQNNWFYGSLVKELSTGKTYILDVAHTDKGEARFNTLGLEVDPNTVGQFTGLKDKNGKEIYENDVLYDEDGSITIIYDDVSAMFGFKWNGKWCNFYDYDVDCMTIIGNIHD